ncbi:MULTISPECIES: type II toxin-antitoxin system RelE/ParE family toxin [Methylococcus]|uniref:Type II toxin-antitoxin system RelE/ParE family toxin n=1 Tax=Methylococcus capsulatus TaxID=414 RepID=A0ABZ2F5K5_METCP|nr:MULTISPECIES: type II toxin-antitoxin system RelE/ParE family toxin [Methylococcus]
MIQLTRERKKAWSNASRYAHVAASCPEMDCEVVFEREEWQAVWLVAREPLPPKPPNLNDAIRLIACEATALLFRGRVARKLPRDIQETARSKLIQIDQSTAVEQLRIPPGNRLDLLKDDWAGSWSIRINNLWRVCFRWEGEHAYDVEIVDYH